jgi:misacylated tRNA(Ala) deacylase
LPNYDPAIIQAAIDAANANIQRDLAVERRVVSRAEFLADASLVKLAAGFPEHIQQIHLVAIPGVDAQACGGTHVDHLGQIGKIVLLKCENRGKNNRRVYLGLEGA